MTKATTRGAFILFEGMDRVGKTTQVNRLLKHLEAKGKTVHHMRFPDRTTETGKMINEYLTNSNLKMDDRQAHLLFSANRHELSAKIKETLSSGVTIVCDRYCFSGAAYTMSKQEGKTSSTPLDYQWCIMPDEGLPTPDVILLLDMCPKQAAARGAYGEERYEKVEFQTTVRKMFRDIRERTKPYINWELVDASKTPDEVSQQITGAADRCYETLSETCGVLTRQVLGLTESPETATGGGQVLRQAFNAWQSKSTDKCVSAASVAAPPREA